MGRNARNGTSRAIELKIIAGAGWTNTVIRRPLTATLLLMMLAAAIGVPTVRAQSASGDVRGTVVEQAGGPLAGVDIVVTNTATGMERRGMTTADGLFSVLGLPAGTYDVTATLDGFAQQRQEGVHIFVGQTVLSRLQLRRAALRETISLAPAPPTVEPLRSDVSSVITSFEIDHLPLSSRNVLDSSCWRLASRATSAQVDSRNPQHGAGGRHRQHQQRLRSALRAGRTGPNVSVQSRRDPRHARANPGGACGAGWHWRRIRQHSDAFRVQCVHWAAERALSGYSPGRRPNGARTRPAKRASSGSPVRRNRGRPDCAQSSLLPCELRRTSRKRRACGFYQSSGRHPAGCADRSWRPPVSAALHPTGGERGTRTCFWQGPITGLPMRIA